MDQMVEEVESAEFRRTNGFIIVLFDQVAKQVEIIVLIIGHLLLETSEDVGKLYRVLVGHFVMNGAGKKRGAEFGVVFGHRVEVLSLSRVHRFFFHLFLSYSACVRNLRA